MKSFQFCFIATVCLTLATGTGWTGAAWGNETVTGTASRSIPGDNVAFFTSSDRSVDLAVTIVADDARQVVDNAEVMIIDRAGAVRHLQTDANGIVKLNGLHEGACAITASKGDYHAAMLVALREISEATDGDLQVFGFSFDYMDSVRPLELQMMKVKQTPLQAIFRQASTKYMDIPLTSIDSHLLEKSPSSESFEGHIQLSKSGTLTGKLLTVMNPQSFYSSVEGTHVVLLKDGVPVRKTVADKQGRFRLTDVVQGTHGLVVFGRGGYAAFSIHTHTADGLIERPKSGRLFAMSQLLHDGEVMPVALIPPPIFNRMSSVFVHQSQSTLKIKTAVSTTDSKAHSAVNQNAESEPKIHR